jgi:hypothetical protein
MKHVPPPTGTPIAGPELTQDSLAARLATQAAEREEALQRLRSLRKEAADEIDRLLEFLDASDIDPDLEPTLGFMNGPPEMDECETPEDDEPSLASLDRMADQTKWAAGGMMDAELDDSDDEPSLGSGAVGVHSTQSQWAQPGADSDDREEDAGDDREEENEHGDHADYEPSLGWTEGMDQGQRHWGTTDDRELSAEPSEASFETARKRHNRNSICNVTPVSGEWWKLEKAD